jgi:hypothetical protein
MRRIRMMGLCLVAVCSLTAVAVSSASAETLPKFIECVKVKGGKFDKGCETEGGAGGFEKEEGFGKGKLFKGVGKASSFDWPKLKSEFSCKAEKDVGRMTGEKTEGKIVITFSGCAMLGKKCTKPGALAGDILTNNLKAELGYINASNHEVGIDLTPETGEVWEEFECEGLQVRVTGSLIGAVTPVNGFTKKATWTFAVNGSGEPDIKNLEGGPEDVLESTVGGQGPFESGLQETIVNTGEELEIEA